MPFMARFVKAGDESAEARSSFSVGEKLTYSLGWQFIVAGHATLEVLPDEEWEERKIRSFQMTAKTNKVADKLFKVRDSLSSLAEYDVSRSLGYSKRQREGDTQRDVSVDFDWENLAANYYEAIGGDRKTTPILENTLDPLPQAQRYHRREGKTHPPIPSTGAAGGQSTGQCINRDPDPAADCLFFNGISEPPDCHPAPKRE
jgi:hypothetical protein